MQPEIQFLGPQLLSPTRLRIARERRIMTMKDLAESIGVTAPTITKYENYQKTPEPETVHKMAFALKFPLGWFYAPDVNLIDVEAPSFRSRRSLTAQLRDKATRGGDIVASVISPEINRRFKLPAVDVPDLAGSAPEEAAQMVRRYWKLGEDPVANMVHLLESKGIEVFWLNEESSCLNAWSLWVNDKPFVLLNVLNPAGDRARFDAAHELGHLVLHRQEKAVDKYQHEMQANDFAAAFLLPREKFRAEVPKYPTLSLFFPLKKRWGVSIAAMVVRGHRIGIFTSWQYQVAFKEIAAKGWRTEEPISLKREASLVHAMVFERLLAKGAQPQDIARDLFMRPTDFYEFMPTVEALAQAQSEIAQRGIRIGHLFSVP